MKIEIQQTDITEQLKNCYLNSVMLAKRHGVKTIAFPIDKNNVTSLRSQLF